RARPVVPSSRSAPSAAAAAVALAGAGRAGGVQSLVLGVLFDGLFRDAHVARQPLEVGAVRARDALPVLAAAHLGDEGVERRVRLEGQAIGSEQIAPAEPGLGPLRAQRLRRHAEPARQMPEHDALAVRLDRKSTRLNSSHVKTSYAVF